MTIDLSTMPYTQRMQVHEAHVRGTYLSIAIDYECLMCDIIAICELPESTSKADFQKYRFKNLFWLEMGKKFKRTKDKLKEYRPDKYQGFLQHFGKIERLIQYRNILAHGYSEYDPHELNDQIITFIHVHKGKTYETTVEISSFLKELESFRNSIMALTDLVLSLRKERGLF